MDLSAEQQRLARAFEEWARRYEADPDGFMSEAESLAGGPVTYGQACAVYFEQLLAETAAATA